MPQFCDPYERAFLQKTLRTDSVFCDIGANAGLYTLTAAQRIITGKIITIEPNPVMAARLRQNLLFNDAQNKAEVIEAAVGRDHAVLSLYLDRTNLGGSSLAVKKRDDADEIKVKVIPLLELAQSQAVTKIDILKIDIEGAEDEALVPFFDRAPSLLYPKHIIIEDSRTLWRQDLMVLLQQKGYVVTARTKMNFILSRQEVLA
jgi:FkbM family methyltransferase